VAPVFVCAFVICVKKINRQNSKKFGHQTPTTNTNTYRNKLKNKIIHKMQNRDRRERRELLLLSDKCAVTII
jgi:hypothetical protein